MVITDAQLESIATQPWGDVIPADYTKSLASELLSWRKLGREYSGIQNISFTVGGQHPSIVASFLKWDEMLKQLLAPREENGSKKDEK